MIVPLGLGRTFPSRLLISRLASETLTIAGIAAGQAVRVHCASRTWPLSPAQRGILVIKRVLLTTMKLHIVDVYSLRPTFFACGAEAI